MKKFEEESLWSLSEAGRYLNIKRSTLYRWVEKRSIPFKRIGRLIRFDAGEIKRWIELHSESVK